MAPTVVFLVCSRPLQHIVSSSVLVLVENIPLDLLVALVGIPFVSITRFILHLANILQESTGELAEGTRNRWFIWFTNLAIDAGFVVAALVPMIVVSSDQLQTPFSYELTFFRFWLLGRII